MQLSIAEIDFSRYRKYNGHFTCQLCGGRGNDWIFVEYGRHNFLCFYCIDTIHWNKQQMLHVFDHSQMFMRDRQNEGRRFCIETDVTHDVVVFADDDYYDDDGSDDDVYYDDDGSDDDVYYDDDGSDDDGGGGRNEPPE